MTSQSAHLAAAPVVIIFSFMLCYRDVLASFGKCQVCRVPKGTPIPDHLVLLHEHGDHYSLQTAVPLTPKKMNDALNKFLAAFEIMSKEEYFDRNPIVNK